MQRTKINRRENMKVLFVISTDDAETQYNAMRLAVRGYIVQR